MEKLFTKTKVLVYIIVALLLLNVATIGTIVWHKNFHRPDREFEHRQMQGKFGSHGDFMVKKLNLSSEQQVQFEKYQKQFWEKGKILMDSMQFTRQKMLENLTASKPDTNELMRINTTLGALHIELKKNTIDYYFNLKKICTPTQLDTLKNMFTRMLEFEGGRGFKPQRDRGHGQEHPRDYNEKHGPEDRN